MNAHNRKDSIMRGRQPSGPEFVDKLEGLSEAKERLKVVLETLSGTCRVQEACERLGIKEARFDQLRIEILQAAVNAAERRPAGRPARPTSPADEENRQLRERIAQLEAEVQAALIRAELALTLPQTGASAQKKSASEPSAAGTAASTEEIVVNQMKNMIPSEPVAEGPPRRGFAGQRVEREQEQTARRHAVDFSQRLFEEGWDWSETADLLGLAPRTLRDWRLNFTRNPLRILPLGRPILGVTREQRNAVIRRIDQLGPGIGLPSLRLEFPSMARAELDDILHRYRRVWRKRNRRPLHVLHWNQPGAVWAIDFHGPRPLVDGLLPYLFAVRDLASGHVLLWLPVADVTADTVVAALTDLFIRHGAPLVVKSDNGSAFIAEAVRQLAKNFGVNILYRRPVCHGTMVPSRQPSAL
jgi:hypothetical protein